MIMCIRTGAEDGIIRAGIVVGLKIDVIRFNDWNEVFTFIYANNPTKIEVRY